MFESREGRTTSVGLELVVFHGEEQEKEYNVLLASSDSDVQIDTGEYPLVFLRKT